MLLTQSLEPWYLYRYLISLHQLAVKEMADVPDSPLPTLTRLGIPPSSPLHNTVQSLSHDSVRETARKWLEALGAAFASGSTEQVLSLMVEGTGLPNQNGEYNIAPFWRDMLALTWTLRTFHGSTKIAKFLSARIAETGAKNWKLREEVTFLQKPFAGTEAEKTEEGAKDLLWINVMFDFDTRVGTASGIARLVPVPLANDSSKAEWKAHVIFTNLESLSSFPPKIGPLRNFQPNHGKWESARRAQTNFVSPDDPTVSVNPKVLVVGGGQSGLEVAARLKYLDVPTLVVEQNERIGDNWRKRYEALCLHDPVCKFFLVRFRIEYSFFFASLRVRSYALPSVRPISTFIVKSSLTLSMLKFPTHLACIHARAEARQLA